MDDRATVAESIVVSGGRVSFTGSAEDAVRRFPHAERIDLQMGCVLPGFVDAHVHLKEYALLYSDLDCTDAHEREEVLQKTAEAASSNKEGEWLRGGGVDSDLLLEMTRHDLDGQTNDRPVILFSKDLHSGLVNSAALAAAGIDRGQKDPLGGRIERDADGGPTGLLRERALELVKRSIPDEKNRDADAAVERSLRNLSSYGITTICDCAAFPTGSPISSLVKLRHRERMKMRVVLMFGDRDAARLGAMGLPSLFGDENLKIGGCKLMIDGSLSSLTALMSTPYKGQETRGMQLMDEQELYEVVRRSYVHYLWTAVHAIGDQANQIALDVYERLHNERGIPRLLKRIEHAQTLQDDQLERFAQLEVIPVGNPSHIPFDREYALRYLGPNARLLHRFGSLREAGARLALSSDAPAGSVNPLHGMYLAVERRQPGEGPQLRFFPKEKLSLNDAVRGYATDAAAALGLADIGNLSAGSCADMVHLSVDPFVQGPESLTRAKVVATYIGGEKVYQRQAGQ
jgi:hypothetical protein